MVFEADELRPQADDRLSIRNAASGRTVIMLLEIRLISLSVTTNEPGDTIFISTYGVLTIKKIL